MSPKMIIAVDPGGTTGIARWCNPKLLPDVPEWTRFEIGPCNEDGKLRHVVNSLSNCTLGAQPFSAGECSIHLLVEPFQFRKDDSHRDKIDYIAGEVIGAIRMWAYERSHVCLHRQGASYGVEGFWSDEKVKKIGLWKRGERHAMDATKHILMYRTFKLDDQSLLMLLR